MEAVSKESDTLDQEIRNLKTELELRRELANNSPMAIIQRHGTRAAGSRGIYEGDLVPTASTGSRRVIREATHEHDARQLAAPALAVQPARGEGAAVRWCLSPPAWAPTSSASTSSAAWPAGSGGWRLLGLLPGVAGVPVRRDGLRLGWMRRRLLAREGDDTQARRRLVRSESPASSPSWRWRPAC